MRIAIIGTGGVGGYFGGKLADVGFDVSFLARGKHLETIRENGLQIKSIHGDFHVKNTFATDNIEKLGKADLIIVCTKSWQVKELREELKNIVHTNTTILPLQNGVLAAEELSEVINPSNIINGLCRGFMKIESPGIIKHFAVQPTIIFGERNKTISNRIEAIKKIFDKAGITSVVSLDIESELWQKFILVCTGGLLAVTKTSYGELIALKETKQMMNDLLEEIYHLSQKIGINIETDFIKKTISFIETFPYDSKASLTRDILEGRPSEIHYQNGTVVKLAEKYGVNVPINKFVYHSILPMEIKARGIQ